MKRRSPRSLTIARFVCGIVLGAGALAIPFGMSASADVNRAAATANEVNLSGGAQGQHGSTRSSTRADLPNTGGPRQELLWAGGAILGLGSTTIYIVRRRNANA